MQKSFQIIRNVTVNANNDLIISDRMRQDYSRTTKVFIIPMDNTTDMSRITIGLKIANYEVLPSAFDASLITFDSNVSRDDVAYNFAEEQLPAKSAELEIQLHNYGSTSQTFNIYFVVEN